MNIIESNRVDEFRAKPNKRFFSTINGFVGEDFFTNNGVYDEKGHQRYNERATNSLLSYLKRMGLEYQKITGIWDGVVEKSFLVWNTAYTWKQFQQIMFKLNKLYRQWAICIGRKIDDRYEINLWQTDNLENIEYKMKETYTTVKVDDALKDFGTVLTRKIYGKDGKIDYNKVKNSIKFEELQKNVCAASSDTFVCNYVRRRLIKELMETDSIMLGELQKNICMASSECLMGAYQRRELLKELTEVTSIESLEKIK